MNWGGGGGIWSDFLCPTEITVWVLLLYTINIFIYTDRCLDFKPILLVHHINFPLLP